MVNEQIKSVQFQLTTACNERCIFCRKYTWEKKELSIKKLKEKLIKFPNAYYQFSGGEPTMYSQLAELNKLLVGKHYKVYTNGAVYSSNEEAIKFLENADEIAISFDAMNHKTYNAIRRPIDEYAFYRVCRTAARFANKAKLSMVVTSENIKQLPLVLKFADEIEIKSRFYPVHTNTVGLVVTEEQLANCKVELEKLELKHKELTNAFSIFEPGYFTTTKEFIPCKARNYSRLVDEVGKEYFCCYAINDNGTDIEGKYAIPEEVKSFDCNYEYEYCDHCSRYRHFNNNAISEGPMFM